MRQAYGVNNSCLQCMRGLTIAIVETGYISTTGTIAGAASTITNMLNTFDSTLNVTGPAITISVTNLNNSAPLIPQSEDNDIGVETMLDVEWAHVMAPGANILVVDDPDILAGANFAAGQTGVAVVSISYGYLESETSALQEGEPFFQAHPNVAFVASSSGDQKSGEELDYPASSPNVIGVGVGQKFTSQGAPGGGARSALDPNQRFSSYGGGGGFKARVSFPEPAFPTRCWLLDKRASSSRCLDGCL